MSDSSSGDTRRVMVDLETLGLEPGAAILSIGAVEFDMDGTGETFYQNVSLSSCDNAGLEIDADTLEWWLDQDDSVQDVLTGGRDLGRVLWDFTAFYLGADEIWANAPSFDCEILDAAYRAVDSTPPWDYYDERCYRTLKNLPGAVEIEHDGDEHNALDDAVHQAERASRTLAKWDETARTDGGDGR